MSQWPCPIGPHRSKLCQFVPLVWAPKARLVGCSTVFAEAAWHATFRPLFALTVGPNALRCGAPERLLLFLAAPVMPRSHPAAHRPPCVGRATSKGAILAECPLPRTDKVRSRLRLTSGNRPFRQCLERCCAAETSVLRYMPDDQRMFDFRSLSANATPVEVLRLPFRKVIWLQCLAKNSPNQRSHRVRRKSGSENGFWVNRRRGSV